MGAINYFKFDLRTIKSSSMIYQVIVILCGCIFMLSLESYKLGMSYLLLCLVICATIPFSLQSSEKHELLYYIMPSKISKMVLGRFLYLITLSIIIILVNGFVMFYSYRNNLMNSIDILVMCLTSMLAIIICFCQYPIYYKFGIEQGKVLSMMLYFIPAFIVFMLPSFLNENGLFIINKLEANINIILSNKISAIVLLIIIAGIIGSIAYFISCRICIRKEV